MLKFPPPLTPKFSKFTLPHQCARRFRRRPIQAFKHSSNQTIKQSNIQAISHPPLCATIPSSPHSSIQTIKHSNNQAFKQSSIQAFKHSSNPPPSTVRDDSVVAPLARRANNILSVKIIFVSLQIENSTNYGEQSTE